VIVSVNCVAVVFVADNSSHAFGEAKTNTGFNLLLSL
jgi:hypothetical protein